MVALEEVAEAEEAAAVDLVEDLEADSEEDLEVVVED